MVLDGFRDVPGFPFPRYFEDVGQFISAQRYWAAVLRATPGWVETDWAPLPAGPLTADQRFDGEVLALGSTREPKQILLQTKSVEGEVASLLRYNDGLSAEELARSGGEAMAIPPMTRAEAEAEARLAPALLAWVEAATAWRPLASHPAGGVEVPVERLILTAEISERAEARALRALEAFVRPGPAMRRFDMPPSPDADG